MTELPYTVIRSRKQYEAYCDRLETLLMHAEAGNREETDLLTLLIEDWDRRQHDEPALEPVALLNLLMQEHGTKAVDLASLLGLSKSAVSNILNHRRRLTAEHIRILARHFGIRQEALNRPYGLQPVVASAACEPAQDLAKKLEVAAGETKRPAKADKKG